MSELETKKIATSSGDIMRKHYRDPRDLAVLVDIPLGRLLRHYNGNQILTNAELARIQELMPQELNLASTQKHYTLSTNPDLSMVRYNLLTERGYTPYCGSVKCRYFMPRLSFNGEQFSCRCGWATNFPKDFMEKYMENRLLHLSRQ